MQGSSLIQLSLIMPGLISATTGAQLFFLDFSSIFYESVTETELRTKIFGLSLFHIGIYFLIAWLLVSKSKEWAKALSHFTRLNSNFSVSAKPRQILFLLSFAWAFTL